MKRTSTLLTLMILTLVVPTFAQQPGPTMPNPVEHAAADVQFAPDVYVVIMLADPVVAYEGKIAGYEATEPGKGKKVNPNSAHVRKYGKYLKASHDRALKAVGLSPNQKIYDYLYAVNGFAAQLTVVQAAELAKQPGVAVVRRDEMRFPTIDSSPDFLGLTDPGGSWAKGYDGKGIVIGVIDSGIWPEHPSFTDDGG